MEIKLPFWIDYILNILISHEYEGYVVGGCVRDSLLNKTPKDYDITTNATPEQVKYVFKNRMNIIDTGIKHGTITLMADYAMDESNIYSAEVTTFRIDGKYSDNRRPDSVSFTSSLKEDLARRDFTINSLAYNYKEGLIDLFDGQKDLENKLIKCVGNPDDRFNEDALRMLRCIRFSAQLGFKIDYNTLKAIISNASKIQNVSVERISMELNKILWSNYPKHIKILWVSGLLKYIIPELDECFSVEQNSSYHIYTVGYHIVESLENIEPNLVLRLTMLLHDIGKKDCKTTDENGVDHFYGHGEISSKLAVEILGRLRYDNLTIMRVRDLVLYHDAEIHDNRKSVRRWLNKVGEETFRELLKVREADIKAQNLILYQDRHDKIERIKTILEDVLSAEECFSKKDLAINGTDLINMGYPEGKQIGEIINKLVDVVIDSPELNTKEQLIELVRNV
jgi:tRNA nucleotidyltransferase (CCA-adding enzyme)